MHSAPVEPFPESLVEPPTWAYQASVADTAVARQRASLWIASVLLLASCGGGGSGGGNASSGTSTAPVTMSGTAATGKALANASVSMTCARGSASTASDGNGNYSASFMAALPCLITVTSGSTVLHSVAFAGGTFNTTPETELLLDYLSAQLGTNLTGLFAGLTSSVTIEQVLGNAADVASAETAVVQTLDKSNQVSLTTTAFLTQSFSATQSAEDTDLEMLNTAGAVDVNGMPVAATSSAVTAAGAANPISNSGTTNTGGAGGQSGGIGGMGGGMM